MDMIPEEIRDCAVRVVEDFINKKIPLSQGVASCAEAQGLNPEQIKRVIEATNSIAYLKLLNGATDRTFEFPVAEYVEVMGYLALPNKGLIVDTTDPKTQGLPMDEAINKQDIGMFAKTSSEYSTEENQLFLMKAYIRNKHDIEKLANRKEEIKLDMEAALIKLQNDKYGLEKLAEVSEEQLFNALVPFFGLEKKAEEGIVFRDEDLVHARCLVNLCKEAVSVVAEEKQKLGFDKQAASILSGVKGSAGKVVGGFVSKLPIKTTGEYAGNIAAGAALAGPAIALKAAKHLGGWGVFNRVAAVAGASTYKPKNEDVWKALHG